MNRIEIVDGAGFSCAEGDTLLRAGLRAGLGLPYECNAGGCGTCKVELIEGAVESRWPEAPGLSDRDRRKGRVLACQSLPTGDCRLRLRLDPACIPEIRPERRKARLTGMADITRDIREFRFAAEGPARFRPGQYAMLSLPDGTERAYSLSNIANADGASHFQIRRVPDGRMTERLFDAAPTEIMLDGPYGLAHLQPGARDVVCIAGGSGLAPMVSIARGIAADPADARRVHFFHGGRTSADLPGEGWARTLTGLGDRLAYHAAVSDESVPGLAQGFVHEVLAAWMGDRFDNYDYYCAGPPPMIQALETLLVATKGLPAGRVRFDRFF
ncbi:MAG: 2Fe-2S iron-sulfur cluster binding domain-containing protein [Zavarzinia sp.]|nr:2Fe-2S iron-sulfur cluster binding domain-containing protein [Zavarzinia sp.]